MMTMGDFRLYLLNFPEFLGSEATSWGAIKKIHR